MWAWASDDSPRCYRTLPIASVNIVSGKIRKHSLYQCNRCERERGSGLSASCGEKAVHWSPIEKDGLFDLIKHTDDLSSK